jgi:2-polyprenyl-3-methyl-5-hydroxy-6-metoxy-1,4-benzoquinol methylase
MGLEDTWSRQRAVDIHNETVDVFAAWYRGEDVFDSEFRYGRHLIDQAWSRCVAELPPRAKCLDIGSGLGIYMERLCKQGLDVTGIEPSAEMRRLAGSYVPTELVSDGSVLQLAAADDTYDFVYAIEVFRYLDACDNEIGHREIARVLKPGGIYFGTYVNRWALDGYRQLVMLRMLAARLRSRVPRHHVEFETPGSVQTKLRQAGFVQVDVHGAMFAPLRILHKLSHGLGRMVGKRLMPHEAVLSDGEWVRALAGHLVAIAHR